MKKYLLLILLVIGINLQSQSVVVNKYFNHGTLPANDVVELLVISPGLNMQGMIIKDFSSSNANDGGGKFTFSTNALWASVPAGTLIILRNNNTAADIDVSDNVLDVGLANTTYFTGTGSFDISGSDMVMIKSSGSGTAGVTGSIHALASGTITGAQYTSAPTPKLGTSTTTGTGLYAYATNSTSSLSDFNGAGVTGGATGLVLGVGNNATNISYINSLKILPVELSTFTAKNSNNKVQLNWATSTEKNNYGFDVERSSDNSNFTKIAFIKGNGNSNSAKEYAYADNSVNAGKYQYRLKQIDNDGSFSYSSVVSVDVNNQPKNYSVSQNYPNPFNPSTKINYSLPYESRVTLTIYNVIGEVVSEMNKVQGAGNYDFNFNASNLKSGIYIYKLNAVSLDGKSSFTNTKKMTLVK